MRNSLGIMSITKHIFWPIFYSAWQKSFTTENIQSAFEATGIFPLNASQVLNILDPSSHTPQRPAPTHAKTPVTFKSFRYAIQMQKKAGSTEGLERIRDGFAKVITERDLNKATVEQLTEALLMEKKKKQRGKRLNLLGEEDNKPQIFTPSKIQAALARNSKKEQEEEQKKEEKDRKKEEVAQLRARKQLEKEEQRTNREIARQVAREEKAKKAAIVKANKEAKKQAQGNVKVQEPSETVEESSPPSNEAPAVDDDGDEWSSEEEAPRLNSRGRVLRKPSRFVY